MTLTITWSLLEAPVSFFGAGIVLAILAFVKAGRIPQSIHAGSKSHNVSRGLMAIIVKSGGPGYLAAFILAGALMFFVLALHHLVGVLPYVIGL